MNYASAIEYLYSLRWFGAKLGLENSFRLAELAGNPQQKLRFIHVAGTNGKGSTCAMLESIYRTAGLRVGLFTSPHLVSFSERIQVNRQLISEQEVVATLEELRPCLQQFPAEHHPTFFEVVMVMALQYFARKRCDLVIWETGLGGRLDATNIVHPLASVITNIQYDHQKWLGETLTSIAREKAGILKPGVPAITAAEAPEALDVIVSTAIERKCPLTRITEADLHKPPLKGLRLPLLGHHQRINAATAIATIGVLQETIPIADEEIRSGLSRVHWPGRLQTITLASGQKVLLDGAHNPGGAEILADALRRHFSDPPPTLILGILADKDWQQMCRLLAPLARRILVVPVQTERTTSPAELAQACAQANPAASVSQFDTLSQALVEAAGEPFICIAGSLYLVGEAMEELSLSPAAGKERRLNEWGAKHS